MNFFNKLLLIILVSITGINCSSKYLQAFQAKEVYKSENLRVIQIGKNSFQHISFLQTNDFGKVPCNGLIVRDNREVLVFDTPPDNNTSAELIKWIKETLNCKINAVVPTHFHDDCLGGLKAFQENGIPSYAYFKTIELAKQHHSIVPENSFQDSVLLKVGDKTATVRFFGEGHTRDNVIGYFPSENLMFGGCLIKAIGASKGNLEDANVADWSGTVEKVKKEYPDVRMIVPGHGELGDSKLLDYTIKLFGSR